jgi:hypothetical protein
MGESAYRLVRTDKGKWLIFYGSERPKQPPKDENEARLKAIEERWIPDGWELVESFHSRKEAEKAREQKAKEGVRADIAK